MSLDTHPASNALVVTYEILVSIVDAASGKELSRRNKRAQLLIHIKEFDQLESNPAKVDLGRISLDIIKKCPLLLSSSSSESQNLDDIQLHLLYLINRRQSSLLARNQDHSRPASALSSARPGSRLQSGRQQPSISRQLIAGEDGDADIYSFVRAREAKNQACCLDLAKFDEQFNAHLDSIEATHQELSSKINTALANEQAKIDIYLEGLYGDRTEQFLSLAIIRRLCGCTSRIGADAEESTNVRLIDVASNRLLICAMMRNLRDASSVPDECGAREFILACLMRMTTYEQVYLATFESSHSTEESSTERELSGSSIDVIKILGDLLAEHIKCHSGSSQQQEQPLIKTATATANKYIYLSAILVVLINLLKISKDNSDRLRLEQRFLASPQDSSRILGLVLSDLFQLNAKDLMREIRLMGKPLEVIQLLNANIILLRQLSCLREFIQRIRRKNQLFDSLVNLLNCVQLSRPGSGNPAAAATRACLIRDKQTLNELYHLELNLLMLVNNLVLDSRIKVKLIKRKLLKPVLRNLVIFFATTNSNETTLRRSETAASIILMVPFRGLYELSCDKSVRLELFKSKIIMKCLLEYLLSSLTDVQFSAGGGGGGRSISKPTTASTMDDGSISIEPANVGHYILSVWINLSSLGEAPIFQTSPMVDQELSDLLAEYVDSALDKLHSLLPQMLSPINDDDDDSLTNPVDHNLIYLHLKLLRNCSQFMRFAYDDELEFYRRCLIRLSELCGILFDSLPNTGQQKSYLIECLACLSNLVAAKPPAADSSYEEQEAKMEKMPLPLASMFGKLLRMRCEDFVGEEDDDLLLVSIQLIGFMAHKFDICHPPPSINGESDTAAAAAMNQEISSDQKFNATILRACNFVLDSKLADHELIMHTLYSLSQLMNHSHFLKTLLSATHTNRGHIEVLSVDDEAERESNLSSLAELLVDRLANLVHSGAGSSISRLALELLNLFRQLEQQTSIESSFVHKIRFANYNSKWLAAIQASREALELPPASFAAAPASARGGRFSARNDRVAAGREPASDAASWFGGDGELLFGQQYDDQEEDDHDQDDFVEDTIVGKRLFNGQQLPAMLEEEKEDEDDGDDADADDDDDEEDDGVGSDSASSEAPDLNVIDPNSMIKHLSSRRQLRQQMRSQRSQ